MALCSVSDNLSSPARKPKNRSDQSSAKVHVTANHFLGLRAVRSEREEKQVLVPVILFLSPLTWRWDQCLVILSVDEQHQHHRHRHHHQQQKDNNNNSNNNNTHTHSHARTHTHINHTHQKQNNRQTTPPQTTITTKTTTTKKFESCSS